MAGVDCEQFGFDIIIECSGFPPALEQACPLTSTHPILICHLCWDPHPSSLQKAPPEEGAPLFPLRDPLTIHLALHIPTTAMVLQATTTALPLGK